MAVGGPAAAATIIRAVQFNFNSVVCCPPSSTASALASNVFFWWIDDEDDMAKEETEKKKISSRRYVILLEFSRNIVSEIASRPRSEPKSPVMEREYQEEHHQFTRVKSSSWPSRELRALGVLNC